MVTRANLTARKVVKRVKVAAKLWVRNLKEVEAKEHPAKRLPSVAREDKLSRLGTHNCNLRKTYFFCFFTLAIIDKNK